MKKIAIIGSGISGLTAAYYLYKNHDITLYEADSRLGGHTATKNIVVGEQDFAIDTGFIVFNDWTYPNFIRLLNEIGVESQPTDMGFSVFEPASGFEYAGTNLFTLFAQKRNLFSLNHWRMLRDIIRFNRESIRDLDEGTISSTESLQSYLTRNKYSAAFINRYLIPMGAAIWSSTQGAMLNFPVEFFVRFFKNHGLLNVVNRPQWRVIKGGSHNYIQPLTAGFKDKIKLNSAISKILRHERGVILTVNGVDEHFDEVVIACHSDQAIKMLSDISLDETSVLGAIAYQSNSVVLHTDKKLMPRKKSTWSSWNYCLQPDNTKPPILTYSMNILQSIDSNLEFLVTLNADEKIEPNSILGKYEYAHPVFNQASLKAQGEWKKINGVNHTWFCGAYWFNGFHEDGVNSALRVVREIEGSN